jgi:predicted nucleotidyltransferase
MAFVLPRTTVHTLAGAELAIAESVLYASLFDYPLTLAELRQTLVASAQTPSEIVTRYQSSDALQAVVDMKEGLFFLRGQDALVAERRAREAVSRRFLQKQQTLLRIICSLPYVRLVALSGSIAHLNLDRDGDLDLFIVTRGRRVWTVTVAAVLLAKLLGRRRVLCANYIVADTRLRLDQEDVFTASQVIHLKPLIGRDVYRELLKVNPFVQRHYPNFHAGSCDAFALKPTAWEKGVKRVLEAALAPLSASIEAVCRRLYRAYLIRRAARWRSPDQVRLEPDCLKLHTQSHRQSIAERFAQGSQGLGIKI